MAYSLYGAARRGLPNHTEPITSGKCSRTVRGRMWHGESRAISSRGGPLQQFRVDRHSAKLFEGIAQGTAPETIGCSSGCIWTIWAAVQVSFHSSTYICGSI
jgi:hypothetical protein